jgi:hypothetical protein
MWIQVLSANLGITYTGGWCLKGVQDAFGTKHVYPTAYADWLSGENGHGNHNAELPPSGVQVPVYLALGNVPAGDVAISLGDGRIAACAMPGTHNGMYIYPSLQAYINDYGRANSGATYLGWSEGTGNTTIVRYQPNVTTNDVTTTDTIPFSEVTQEDSMLPVGQTQTVQAGVNGTRTIVTRTTYADGNATGSEVISDVTVQPQAHIVSNGTYVARPPVVDPPVTPPVVTPPINPVPPVESTNTTDNWLVNLIKVILQSLLNIFRKG